MAEFLMPSLGADMESGTLLEWKIQPGQRVDRGDIVAVVETAKGAIEIECFEPGVFERLVVDPGTEVPVGTPLAQVRYDDASVGTTARDVAPPPSSPPTVAAPSQAPTTPLAPEGASQPAHTRDTIRALPRARKLASELGVVLEGLAGSGPEGVITPQDVERAAQSAETTSKPRGVATMQAAIAAAMTRSKREIPHYYLSHDIDVEPVLLALAQRNAAEPPDRRILPVAVWIRAIARALVDFPQMHGWFKDGQHVPAPGVHVAVAISTRSGGLVNPALHDADRGELIDLMARIADVTARARANTLRASELSDATITLTNLGDGGVDAVLPVIHPPQVAILGFGTVDVKPWVVDDQVLPRRVLHISLAADHRVSNGHMGARFVRRIAALLQTSELVT